MLRQQSPDAPGPALAGFEHIQRFWDREHGHYAARLMPGDYYVTKQDEAIVTVLGSCVSACVRDARLRIGGMNHFMLPLEGEGKESAWSAIPGYATRFGNYAMETLINDLMKLGASRIDLEVKVVGGGRMFESRTDIGGQNIAFVEHFLNQEGMKILSRDTGDVFPRKVYYEPATGRLRVKKLNALHQRLVVENEDRYRTNLQNENLTGDIELF